MTETDAHLGQVQAVWK